MNRCLLRLMHCICKPDKSAILRDYRFDRERIQRIDGLRHRIVHETFGSPIENVRDDLEYMERTQVYLSALITHRYGLKRGPEFLHEAQS